MNLNKTTLRAKNVILFTSLDEASSAEENDIKIIKFGWVILNLCPLLEVHSFSNFAWFLRLMNEEFCREKPSMKCFREAHSSVATKETRINGLPQNTIIMEGFSRHNSSLIGRKNQAKFENDCISRNTFARKVLKIRRSAFFFWTPGIRLKTLYTWRLVNGLQS